MSLSNNYPTIKPSLLLDFSNTKQLDPRITFTRTSTATYYDGVTTAMAEQNLLTYSQDFSNAVWVKDGTSLTSGVTDPAGGTTAFRLTATGGNRRIYQSTTQTIGLQYVYSVYMRRVTGTGTISMWNAVQGTVDVTSQVSSTWSRVSVPAQTATVNGALLVLFGTTGDEIDIWGAQAETRSSVTAYTATTTQPITNYIPVLLTAAAGVPRFNHNPTTGESLGLLIEESRTNLLTYSEQFDNAAWTKAQTTVTANAIIAPDGTLTADLVSPTAVTLNHGVFRTVSVSAGAYTLSGYAKAQGASKVLLYGGATGYGFDLANGTMSAVTGITAAQAYSITAVGNGWYRCSITVSAAPTEATFLILETFASMSYAGNVNNGIYIWGAQLEAGAFATSYIPTIAATVTRSADAASMTGTNFSSWYRPDEGTLYAEYLISDITSAMVGDGSNTTALLYSSNRDVKTFNGSSSITTTNQTPLNVTAKAALSYATNARNIVLNASTVVSSANGLQTVSSLQIGTAFGTSKLNGTIKKIAFYPARLTNTQLQALTTV